MHFSTLVKHIAIIPHLHRPQPVTVKPRHQMSIILHRQSKDVGAYAISKFVHDLLSAR